MIHAREIVRGYGVNIAIDRQSDVPLYQQIVQQIRHLITSGSLAGGFRLPPERRLAQILGVNRSTILNAYRELKANGLLEARVGRGTSVVASAARRTDPQHERTGGQEIGWRQLFRERFVGSEDAVLRNLLGLSEQEDTIPLAMGLPAPDHLPLDTYGDLMSEVIADLGPRSLLHSPTEGVTSLREALCDWAAKREISCDVPEVQIVSGSQQGLDMAARVFLDPGDVVVVEEPTYIGALQTFRDAGARLIGVPTDAHGMRTDLLEAILQRRRPKFIYTLPTFQNPSGVVMSLGRRRHLLELAGQYQVPVLEDDPYADLRYDGEPLPALKALDSDNLVLYLSTISKVLFPGLRLGWFIAPPAVRQQFTLVKQGMDLHSSTPGQFWLERYLRRGFHREYLARIRHEYEGRRDVMHRALSREELPGLSWSRPSGGFYFWCALPEGTDRARLLARSAEAGVSFLPGWACFVQDPGRSHIRLNFAYPGAEQIEVGVARLLGAVRYAVRSRQRALSATKSTPPVV